MPRIIRRTDFEKEPNEIYSVFNLENAAAAAILAGRHRLEIIEVDRFPIGAPRASGITNEPALFAIRLPHRLMQEYATIYNQVCERMKKP